MASFVVLFVTGIFKPLNCHGALKGAGYVRVSGGGLEEHNT